MDHCQRFPLRAVLINLGQIILLISETSLSYAASYFTQICGRRLRAIKCKSRERSEFPCIQNGYFRQWMLFELDSQSSFIF